MIQLQPFRFPHGPDLEQLLRLDNSVHLEDLFTRALLDPIQHVLVRPKKGLRATLVQLGFQIDQIRHGGKTSALAESSKETVEKVQSMLELLHAGSMVIDDIEDGSLERRGSPSIHVVYGIPLALNAGNWLYFLPFKIIHELNISNDRQQALAKECHLALLRAHYGQALDVGISFDSITQDRVPEVSGAAIELKTGALTALAFKAGTIVGSMEPELLEAMDCFGKRFGVALQMYDDIGNLTCKRRTGKWAEDIKLKRPTFITSIAATYLSAQEYKVYTTFGTENLEDVTAYLDRFGLIDRARETAESYLQEAIANLASKINLHSEEVEILHSLKNELRHAYET